MNSEQKINKALGKEMLQLVIPAGVIAFAAWLWNVLYLSYVNHHDFKTDIFRPAFHQANPPIYGLATAIEWNWLFVLCLLMLSSLFVFSLLKKRIEQLFFVMMSFLVFTFLFSKTENRFSAIKAHYSTYFEDVRRFTSPTDVVLHYTEQQATLNVHSAHYPPGNMWLIKYFDQYASVSLLKYVLYGLMALSLLILFGLLERISLISFLTIPALFIYPSLDVVALPFFFFSLALLVQLKIESPLWKSIFLGVVSSIWLFFSFSVFVFWLFLLMKDSLVFAKTRAIKPSIVYCFLHGITLVVCFFVLYLIFHFSIIENFKIALAHNVQINSNYFDDPIRFLFRSTGNALEFCLGVGFPIMLLFRKSNSLQPNFLELRNAFLLTLTIASFCGLFFMETDRVWFFLIPIVILLANEELLNSSLNFRRIFTFFAVLYAVWFELSAIHFC